MRRGDIFQLSPDPATGHELQGNRLVLIVSPDRFNACTKVPIVLPITDGNVARTAGFAVSLDGCGTRTTGLIRCDQPRALDVRALQGLPPSLARLLFPVHFLLFWMFWHCGPLRQLL